MIVLSEGGRLVDYTCTRSCGNVGIGNNFEGAIGVLSTTYGELEHKLARQGS